MRLACLEVRVSRAMCCGEKAIALLCDREFRENAVGRVFVLTAFNLLDFVGSIFVDGADEFMYLFANTDNIRASEIP